MEPNLYADQQVIVDKVTYHFRIPERGEIVVIDRNNSRDSRYIGPVALDQVLSRAWLRIWPLEKAGWLTTQ